MLEQCTKRFNSKIFHKAKPITPMIEDDRVCDIAIVRCSTDLCRPHGKFKEHQQ